MTNSAKKYVGQTLVIENKPGADGKIGWTELAKSKPDGQTIGFISLPTYTTLAQMEGSAFTDKSIVPICNHLTETAVVVVKKDAKWNSLKELVADAQANPGQLKCSTNGVQASNHTAASSLHSLRNLNTTQFLMAELLTSSSLSVRAKSISPARKSLMWQNSSKATAQS